jgi:D-sedoheptulose 7-phosphate isomerase
MKRLVPFDGIAPTLSFIDLQDEWRPMSNEGLRAYRTECIEALHAIDLEVVEAVVSILLAARDSGRMVFIAGNGGSAATASHMATDLMFGSQLVDPGLRVIALTDNQAIITATGNDLEFDQIFTRQLTKLAQPGDVLIAISASGNSPNVLSCVVAAKAMNLTTIGFTGFDGGTLASLVDLSIHVPTRLGAYGPTEDVHLAVNHMITEQLKRAK